jgi:hypothetical protein
MTGLPEQKPLRQPRWLPRQRAKVLISLLYSYTLTNSDCRSCSPQSSCDMNWANLENP